MVEELIEQEELLRDQGPKRRLANVISVLLPAREYRLECSWTTERPLPAVEEFACRLILLMDGVSPSELKSYFGLSILETEGLVRNLVKNRLVDVADDGTLMASAMLQAKRVTAGDVPTFTNFETREEDAVFDLLALKIVPRRGYSNARFGLPEIPIPEISKSVPPDRIAEAFSEQSRAFLEYSRGRSKDVHKTRLYKVSRCRPKRTLQVPIDMEIFLEAGTNGELNVYRDAIERLGENRRRALSNELESQVADYLAQESLPSATPSVEDYCELVGDEILARYVHKNDVALAKWLADRDARKTGYGTQETRALLGPIYLTGNRTTLINMLKHTEGDEGASRIAHWLPSSVPFWAANSSELVDFAPKLQRALGREDDGRLVACFCGYDSSEKWLKKKFNSRVPHAVLFSGNVALDRVELLVVPERLVVAQYHLQPSTASAITLPIGFASTDPERVKKVTRVLTSRLLPSNRSSLLWSTDSQRVHSLVDFHKLGLAPPSEQMKISTDRSSGSIVWKRSRL
ncbi:hypothetical protein [Thermomonas aquatica]|uniref:Uncharacterized protein n=1 Tax=Thermomonas aquatica TaxID=2202149 RepID=A0A5B7ZR16_9GAMM|nr:hypothetical protein [Thermomonas aquatica]QDA57219.1 hypothetical protein FHQ07_07775 [Thermomonas aquatica]